MPLLRKFLSQLVLLSLTPHQSSTNPEIDLGDEDDPNLIRAMLRHLYDLPYEYQYDEDVPAPTSQMLSEDPLNFYLEMFTLADKYDIPSLRDGAVEKFDCILRDAMGDKRFASTIQRLFSCMYADRRLQDVTLQFMAENFSAILQESQGFREMLETGTLLDTEIAAKLALKMGAKMQALETRAIPQYQGYADFGSSPQR